MKHRMNQPVSRSDDMTKSTSGDKTHSHGHETGYVARTPGSVSQAFASIGVVEYLENDPKPTFIVDLEANPLSADLTLVPVYCNASLRARHGLQEMLFNPGRLQSRQHPAAAEFSDFRSWASSTHDGATQYLIHDMSWTYHTIRRRWRSISGFQAHILSEVNTVHDAVTPPALSINRSENIELVADHDRKTHSYREVEKSLSEANQTVGRNLWTGSLSSRLTPNLKQSTDPAFDFTRSPPLHTLTPHINFVRNFDWASTPMGPMDKWSSSLRLFANTVLHDPDPAVIFCGPELLMLYNEAYIQIAGKLHPGILGGGPHIPYAGIWDYYSSLFAKVWDTGQAIQEKGGVIFLERKGFVEECYIDVTCSPALGEDGTVVGVYQCVPDSTKRIIGDRRMAALLKLSERTALARDLNHFWTAALDALAENERDVPFALIYTIQDGKPSSDSESVLESKQYVLEGSIGIPDGHPAAPPLLDSQLDSDGYAPILRSCLKNRKPTLLQTKDGTLPETLTEGLQPRGFGDRCTMAILCPLYPTSSEEVLAFLIMGLNTRRPYDEDHQLFIQMLNTQLTTALASVLLYAEEKQRGRTAAEQAAHNEQILAHQLQVQTEEARRSELRWTRFVDRAPMGICIMSLEGKLIFGNDKWLELSGLPRVESGSMSWKDVFLEDDIPLARNAWMEQIKSKKAVTFECRLKTIWKSPDDSAGQSTLENLWVLCSAYPDLYPDGSINYVLLTLTHISQQKWAEKIQEQRVRDAMELKRQQENFIDMTSHEMRNPLSAIIQCTDEILASFTKLQSFQETRSTSYDDIITTGIEAAQTIAYCGQHQRKVIDDVLTSSKLDSNLLVIVPTIAEPVAVAREALKIFESELRADRITAHLNIAPSLKELAIEKALFDPIRVIQVLVNLIGNALKFTKLEAKRQLILTLSVSSQKPSTEENGVFRLSANANHERMASGSEFEGEEIFLQFLIQDTGRGMTPEETKRLFMRFSQASPRTHIDYGGSGLGLFICRKLVELHGGEIGVASELGVGSIFSFYIAARRVVRVNTETQKIVPTVMRDPKAQADKIPHMAHSAPDCSSHAALIGPKSMQLKPPSKIHILVVEDNLVNQKIMTRQLRSLGYMVSTADHGGEALAFLESTIFWKEQRGGGIQLSICLMDIEMPIMDGTTCVSKVRQLENEGSLLAHVPVIAVTANARPEQVMTYRKSGFDDVVSKPFRMKELVPQMERLLQSFGICTDAGQPRQHAT